MHTMCIFKKEKQLTPCLETFSNISSAFLAVMLHVYKGGYLYCSV